MSEPPTRDKTMNTNKARKIFDAMIAETTNGEQRAKIELLREYLCNTEFRIALHDEVWKINTSKK
jgi:Mg2+ and Co2+ transporter CorA